MKAIAIFTLIFHQVLYMGPTPLTESLTSNLTHYWAMEEAEAADREDTIDPGATDAWTPTNTPEQVTGINNNGADVDHNEYLDLATTTMFPSTTFTVAFWVKPASFVSSEFSDPPGSPILVSSSHSTGFDIYKVHGTTDIRFVIYPGGQSATITNNPLATGSWHFVVAWFDDDTNIGGMQIDNGTPVLFSGGSFARTSGTMYFPFNTTVGMAGTVDEVALWDGRILRSHERAQLYNAGVGLFYPFT